METRLDVSDFLTFVPETHNMQMHLIKVLYGWVRCEQYNRLVPTDKAYRKYLAALTCAAATNLFPVERTKTTSIIKKKDDMWDQVNGHFSVHLLDII